MAQLTKDTFATGLHGITGRPYEEGTLAAGTLVRNVRAYDDGTGIVTRYQASTDGGRTWYDQLTMGEIHFDAA